MVDASQRASASIDADKLGTVFDGTARLREIRFLAGDGTISVKDMQTRRLDIERHEFRGYIRRTAITQV